MECIARNNANGEVTDCAHCGSENYDTECIPALVQHGKPIVFQKNLRLKNHIGPVNVYRAVNNNVI